MPLMHRHITPFNGEMHFAAHFLHAGWGLHHAPPPQLFAERLEMKYLKGGWAVKPWGCYDGFVMVMVAAIVRWLAHLPDLNHTGGIN